MSRFAGMILCTMVALAFVACDPQPEHEERSAATMRKFEEMPVVKIGAVPGDDPAVRADVEAAVELLEELIAMVDRRDLSPLPDHVNAERGLYVDLKAHRERADISADVRDPAGYLNTYYLDTDALRERTGDPESVAVRDVLRLSRSIVADAYLSSTDSGERQIELRLRLEDAPTKSYYLNNPVFVKDETGWTVFRLF